MHSPAAGRGRTDPEASLEFSRATWQAVARHVSNQVCAETKALCITWHLPTNKDSTLVFLRIALVTPWSVINVYCRSLDHAVHTQLNSFFHRPGAHSTGPEHRRKNHELYAEKLAPESAGFLRQQGYEHQQANLPAIQIMARRRYMGLPVASRTARLRPAGLLQNLQ